MENHNMEQFDEITQEDGQKRLSMGRRISHWFHRLNSGRYEEVVPAEIRELAERNNVPLPTRFVPSIEGRRVRISRPIDSGRENHPSDGDR
jgi:hypothetical protein